MTTQYFGLDGWCRLSIMAKLLEIGSRVEPYIEKYLRSYLDEEFSEVVLHQVKSGGKRVRPALTILCCEAVGGDPEDAMPAAAAMELIHNYSLIFDDIIDHGDFRRGLPTTRKLYGDVMAMLAGLHYREAICEAICDCKNSERLHRLVAKTVKLLVEGERLDVLFEQAGREEESYILRHRRKVVSKEEYIRMIRHKTGALIQASCLAGGIVAGAPENYLSALGEYGISIGIAFQIADDILDIFAEEKKLGKKVGKDIIEHKLGNIVILYALEELDEAERRRLLDIIRSPEVSEDMVKEAVKLINSTNARERAYGEGWAYVKKALKALELLPKSEAREILKGLAEFIISRSY